MENQIKHRATDKEIADAVLSSYAFSEVCAVLGWPRGKHYNDLIRQACIRENQSLEHFDATRSTVFRNKHSRMSDEEWFVEGVHRNGARSKERLFSSGLKEQSCESCGLSEWLGSVIPLEIDHVNGVHTDNRVENLCILCPNCHAKTDTYRGKNINRAG